MPKKLVQIEPEITHFRFKYHIRQVCAEQAEQGSGGSFLYLQRQRISLCFDAKPLAVGLFIES